MLYDKPNVNSNLLSPQMDPNDRTTYMGFLGLPYFHWYDLITGHPGRVAVWGVGGLFHLDEPTICAAPVLDAAAWNAVPVGFPPWHDCVSQHLALPAEAWPGRGVQKKVIPKSQRADFYNFPII